MTIDDDLFVSVSRDPIIVKDADQDIEFRLEAKGEKNASRNWRFVGFMSDADLRHDELWNTKILAGGKRMTVTDKHSRMGDFPYDLVFTYGNETQGDLYHIDPQIRNQ